MPQATIWRKHAQRTVSWLPCYLNLPVFTCNLCTVLLIYLFDLCDACMTVFVYCLVKQLAIYLGDDAVLSLNVIVLVGFQGEVLYWRDHEWFSIRCMCFVCDPIMHLNAPSICFVCVFVCRKLSLHWVLILERDHICYGPGNSLRLICILHLI